ncbi:unnamed protein product [Allacma fusca]|uniref:FAS1 domain-containing protein n=1 Tax=Allacma fusca TaxID=39272 RepID=A0A8J2JT17_9HEXA|nr:unnamed protein product [Allacma fusca]
MKKYIWILTLLQVLLAGVESTEKSGNSSTAEGYGQNKLRRFFRMIGIGSDSEGRDLPMMSPTSPCGVPLTTTTTTTVPPIMCPLLMQPGTGGQPLLQPMRQPWVQPIIQPMVPLVGQQFGPPYETRPVFQPPPRPPGGIGNQGRPPLQPFEPKPRPPGSGMFEGQPGGPLMVGPNKFPEKPIFGGILVGPAPFPLENNLPPIGGPNPEEGNLQRPVGPPQNLIRPTERPLGPLKRPGPPEGPFGPPQRPGPPEGTFGPPQRPSPPEGPFGPPQRPSPPEGPFGPPQRPGPPEGLFGPPQRPVPQEGPFGPPQRPVPQEGPFGPPQRPGPPEGPFGPPQRPLGPPQGPIGQPQGPAGEMPGGPQGGGRPPGIIVGSAPFPPGQPNYGSGSALSFTTPFPEVPEPFQGGRPPFGGGQFFAERPPTGERPFPGPFPGVRPLEGNGGETPGPVPFPALRPPLEGNGGERPGPVPFPVIRPPVEGNGGERPGPVPFPGGRPPFEGNFGPRPYPVERPPVLIQPGNRPMNQGPGYQQVPQGNFIGPIPPLGPVPSVGFPQGNYPQPLPNIFVPPPLSGPTGNALAQANANAQALTGPGGPGGNLVLPGQPGGPPSSATAQANANAQANGGPGTPGGIIVLPGQPSGPPSTATAQANANAQAEGGPGAPGQIIVLPGGPAGAPGSASAQANANAQAGGYPPLRPYFGQFGSYAGSPSEPIGFPSPIPSNVPFNPLDQPYVPHGFSFVNPFLVPPTQQCPLTLQQGRPLCPTMELLDRLQLRIITNLIRLSGLEPLFQQTNNYTFFAPVDPAFHRLPTWFMTMLQQDRKLLRAFILQHYLKIDVPLDTVANEFMILNARPGGNRLRFNVYHAPNEYRVFTVDGSRIEFGDIPTIQGRLNIMNRVLIPNPPRNAAQYLQEVPEFRPFMNSVLDSDCLPLFQGDEPITLFIPYYKAFDEFDLQALQSNKTALRNFVRYHVVPGTFYSEGLVDGQYLPTLYDKEIKVSITSDNFARTISFVNGDIRVVKANIPILNGVAHIISHALSSKEFFFYDHLSEFSVMEFGAMRRSFEEDGKEKE